MENNPDEEATQQIRYRPQGDPNQQANYPAAGQPPGAEGYPANVTPPFTGAPSDEAPTMRPPSSQQGNAPSQANYPAPTEGYLPMPPGSYPDQQQGGNSSARQYMPPQEASPAQSESYGQPSASYYAPRLPNYPTPGQGSYQSAPPGTYQPQQTVYPPPRQDYPPEQYGAPHPSVPPPPPAPTMEQSGVNPFSQQFSPPPPPPMQQTQGNSYTSTLQGAAGAAGARSAFNAQQFWRDLTLLGQASGIAGILMVIFFFLPWSYTPDFSANLSGRTNIPTVTHSGWQNAAGVQFFSNVPSLNLFPHLWLVLLCALALIVLAVMLGLHRIRVRTAALLISLISLTALLLEFFFLIQISSLGSAIRTGIGNISNQNVYGTSWGFWLEVVATIAALGVGVYMLLEAYAPDSFRRRQRTPGMPGGPGQYPTPTA